MKKFALIFVHFACAAILIGAACSSPVKHKAITRVNGPHLNVAVK